MSNEYSDKDPAGDDPVEGSEQRKIQAIASVVPVHAVTTLKRKPGRPRKINPQATVEDLAYHAEMSRRKAAFIDENPVLKAIRGRKDSLEILHNLREEAATAMASLHFQRIEDEKYGRDTAQIASRHLAAIRDVAMLELEMKKMGATLIDLKSERFHKIFRFLISIIHEVAEEVLPTEQADLFLNRLETRMENWEEQAQNL